jgi:hypothetical protein
MEESLRLHIEDRDRLRKELAGNTQPQLFQKGTAPPVSERT